MSDSSIAAIASACEIDLANDGQLFAELRDERTGPHGKEAPAEDEHVGCGGVEGAASVEGEASREAVGRPVTRSETVCTTSTAPSPPPTSVSKMQVGWR